MAALGLALGAAACGKKGSPLPPLVKMPAVPRDVSVRRSGDTVYVRFTVPTMNADATSPADVSRLQVYAYTANRDVAGIETRDMVLVGEVLVRKAVDPADLKEERENPEKARKAAARVRPEEPGVEQGETVTVTEALTTDVMAPTRLPKHLQPLPVYVAPPSPLTDPVTPPVVAPASEPGLRRFYVVYGVNHRGQRGNPSARFAVMFDVQPLAPGAPVIAVSGRAATLTWNPPKGAAEPLQSIPPDPQLLPSSPRGLVLPVVPAYNVYLVERGEAEKRLAGAPRTLPVPLNDKPLAMPTFVDNGIEFGKERCYQVRTVNTAGSATMQVTTASSTGTGTAGTSAPLGAPGAAGAGPAATPATAESAPSPVACVVPADTEPPPTPAALAAVSSAGAISLIWNAVDAADLAGYIVLRAQGTQGAMTPLFATPITETTYRDTTVQPGVRYAYVVIAVDKATPPNKSAASNRVEETAR